MSPRDEKQDAEEISEQPDNDDSKRKGSPEHGIINSTAMSDGEFADLSETLLDFSNADERTSWMSMSPALPFSFTEA